jgi:hypothetical protein
VLSTQGNIVSSWSTNDFHFFNSKEITSYGLFFLCHESSGVCSYLIATQKSIREHTSPVNNISRQINTYFYTHQSAEHENQLVLLNLLHSTHSPASQRSICCSHIHCITSCYSQVILGFVNDSHTPTQCTHTQTHTWKWVIHFNSSGNQK